jgi:fimbrial chaperone protein
MFSKTGRLRRRAASVPRSLAIAASLIVAVSVPHPDARCADFSAFPLRLDLSQDQRTGELTLTGEGVERAALRIAAYVWTQDGAGNDVYAEASDFVVSPKRMTLGRGERRTVRAGFLGPSPVREKTYRIVIRNEGAKGPDERAFFLSETVPVFMKPAQERRGMSLGPIAIERGNVAFSVRNTGTVHGVVASVIVRGASADGRTLLSKELAGWYVLSGASRGISAAIPPHLCRRLAWLDIAVATSVAPLNDRVPVDREQCAP